MCTNSAVRAKQDLRAVVSYTDMDVFPNQRAHGQGDRTTVCKIWLSFLDVPRRNLYQNGNFCHGHACCSNARLFNTSTGNRSLNLKGLTLYPSSKDLIKDCALAGSGVC